MTSTTSFIIKNYTGVLCSSKVIFTGPSLSMHLWILIIPEYRINLRELLLDLAGNESHYSSFLKANKALVSTITVEIKGL